MSTSGPHFAKCSCQHCNGHIEFDAGQAGEVVTCPHCGLETKLLVPAIPPNARVETKRGVSPLGIAALVLGILACLFCWIPLLGLFALPIAFIGVLLAVGGIVMSSVNKKTGFAFPIGGGFVCVLAVSIALVITGGFSRAIELGKRTIQQAEQPSPPQEPTSKSRLQIGDDWSKSRAVKQGDIKVTLNKVHIGRVEHNNVLEQPQITQEELFTIDLAIANLSPNKKIDFQTPPFLSP